MCKLSGGKVETQLKVEKPEGFKCGTFKGSSLEERRFATGSFKGTLDVWDLERMDTPTYSARQHDGIVNCIDGVGGRDGISAPELVTGGRDGSLLRNPSPSSRSTSGQCVAKQAKHIG